MDGSALFEHSPLGIVVFQPEGTIVRANPVFARWTGVAPDGLVAGRNLWNLLAGASLQRALAEVRKLVEAAAPTVEFEARLRGPGEVLLPVRAVVSLDGELSETLLVAQLSDSSGLEQNRRLTVGLESRLARAQQEISWLEEELAMLASRTGQSRLAQLATRRFERTPCELAALYQRATGQPAPALPRVEADVASIRDLFELLCSDRRLTPVEAGSLLDHGRTVIFLRFLPHASPESADGGNGMDVTRLACLKRIVRRHGGEIWRSLSSQGETWLFTLEASSR